MVTINSGPLFGLGGPMRAYLQQLVCAVTAIGFFAGTGAGCGGGETPGSMAPPPLPGLMAGWGNR